MTETKSYVVTLQPNGSYKSIPLNALPAEAWKSLTGGMTPQGKELLDIYETVSWFRRGVDARCEAMASMPFVFVREGSDEELDEGEIPDFPFELDFENLLNVVEGWLTLFGAAYLFRGVNAFSVPKEIRPMHPETITPKYDDEKGLIGFERRIKATTLMLSKDELIYFWLPNRRSEIGPGKSPAHAAMIAAGLLANSDDFTTRYFDNGVIAPTLVTVPAGTSTTEKERLESWVKRTIRGLKNAFSVLAISADVQVNPLGTMLNLGSLGIDTLTDKKREDIATALGVPQSILFSNAANFAVADADDRHFYTKTIIPESKRIERVFNTQLFKLLGWELKFKPELIETFQRAESEKAASMVALAGKPIYSVNEAREEMGREPVPGGDWEDAERQRQDQLQLRREQIQAMARQPQQNGQPSNNPPPKEDEPPAKADLQKWRVMAVKRLAEGKPEKALAFQSSTISAFLKWFIEDGLKITKTAEDINDLFDQAAEWGEYP